MSQLHRAATLCTIVFAAAALGACEEAVSTQPAAISVAGSRSATLEHAIVLLQAESRSKDPAIRANCIEAIQPLQDPRAVDIIEQGLHDPEWVVRFAAAMAAGKRQELKFKPVLEQLAANDRNGSVRVASTYALKRLGDNNNMNLLAQTLVEKDPSVRANTALVLGLLGNPSAIPLLQTRRSEQDTRVKFEIIAALARLGDVPAQRVITSLALSKFAEDQWNALVVCGDLPAEVAANPLLICFKEPLPMESGLREFSIRRQLIAARSLGKLGSAQGGNFALKYLRDEQPSVRASAAHALGEILTPAGEPRLTKYLDDKNESVQLAAASAIINIWARAESQLGKKTAADK